MKIYEMCIQGNEQKYPVNKNKFNNSFHNHRENNEHENCRQKKYVINSSLRKNEKKKVKKKISTPQASSCYFLTHKNITHYINFDKKNASNIKCFYCSIIFRKLQKSQSQFFILSLFNLKSFRVQN